MTNTQAAVIARYSPTRRLLQGMGYVALLTPVGLLACAEAYTGRQAESRERWWALTRFLGAPTTAWVRRPGVLGSVGLGVASAGVGLLGWFLLALWTLAVVRGPFYGLVESRPLEPGTWGGPTMAGAWVVHAALSLPVIVFLPYVLRGLGLLHSALVRKAAGQRTGWWVLPATALLGLLGGIVFGSCLQQL